MSSPSPSSSLRPHQVEPPHPLSCPRCGCSGSSVIRSQRFSQAAEQRPLEGYRRTRRCDHCGKQFRTLEALEEIDSCSSVWQLRSGGRPLTSDEYPIGEHMGVWTRHTATFVVEAIEYQADTRNPIRVESYPCRVIIDQRGTAVVEAGRAEHE